MTKREQQFMADWKASCKPQPLYGRGPVTSKRKPEISDGWRMFIIVTALLALAALAL